MRSPRRLTLRKGEKLRHRTLVDTLFRNGKTLYDFPLRLTWRVLTEEQLNESFRCGVPDKVGQLQMLVTVPKKKRRHAVDRVLMRRRIREAYRLQRQPLYDVMENGEYASLEMAFIFLCEKNVPYGVIHEKMGVLIGRLAKAIKKQKQIKDGEE